MGRLKKYISPYWGFILFTMFVKLVGALLELLIPYLMEIMLDERSLPEANRKFICTAH